MDHTTRSLKALHHATENDRVAAVLTTEEKALRINLDPMRYGTFAEIGAGQEVARWFFRAGGAAGTISKSISAYDMAVSDAIYGKCRRYVSRERLQNMLDYEHGLNRERLQNSRGIDTAFFAFADTVSARNFQGTNDCQGWMGVKYQAHPRDADSQIVIHVRMKDHENSLQQEALGIIGVNLLYAVCFLHYKPEAMIASLLDNLSLDRIEVDMIEFSGIEFRHVDNRLMSLQLVQLGLSRAAMFGPSGEVLDPSEVLRKRPVVVQRGSFRPVTRVNIDMLNSARGQFESDPAVADGRVVELMEITMRNLTEKGAIDLPDFLARADMLAAAGKLVLISDYSEYYRLASYIASHTGEPMALTMGLGSLEDLFQEHYYRDLEGGILEALGKLFTRNLRIYVYPLLDSVNNRVRTVDDANIPDGVRGLFAHLLATGKIQQLHNFDPAALPIFSRDVLRRIRENDPSWADMVPPEIAGVIRSRWLLGYREYADAMS